MIEQTIQIVVSVRVLLKQRDELCLASVCHQGQRLAGTTRRINPPELEVPVAGPFLRVAIAFIPYRLFPEAGI